MSTRPKTKVEGEDAGQGMGESVQAEGAEEQAPLCGTPHFLPALAHLTCTRPAPDPDLPPGAPEHEHRHQDGETIYTWR